MTSCPNCGKQVDPLRAPAVGVRDGKVVPFCSKECATAMESKPTKLIPTKIVRMPSNADRVATPASGVVAPGAGFIDSGPVIEIIREPASGPAEAPAKPARAKKRPDSSVQVAETGMLDDYVTHEPRGNGLKIAAVILLLIAAAGAGAYALGAFDGMLGTHAPAAVRGDAAVRVQVIADAAPPPVTAAQALARAQDLLKTQMKSDSPRVQRVAASALARTGDKDAIELLAAALGKEPGDLAKLDLAYALARAQDKRGVDALMAAAHGTKRDPKLEAGRRLALLGDKRAIDVLANYLDVSQLRLGIAEQLAYLAEPRALKVLDEVRVDPKAVPDEKARATIALGHAGRADIVPNLRGLLADDRNNAFAAVALAGLEDESARPVLVKQLTIPSLRVQAARSLRLLAPDADVSSLLPPLLAALDSNRDTEQVQIAESILLLAGPSAWSERE
jgi:HEAT repeat protein/YHS domain-containing protein